MTSTLSLTGSDGRVKKLFTRDWLEVVALAEKGRDVVEIAKLYGVDKSVIYKGLRKRKVNVSAVAKRVELEQAELDKTALLIKIRETKDFGYKAIQVIEQKTLKVMLKIDKENLRHGEYLNDIKALKLAVETIKIGSEAKWKILGLDRENSNADAVLPELPIAEMTSAEIEQMRLNQELEDGIDPDALEALIEDDGEDEVPDIIDTSDVVAF